ncbi:cytochrome P450 monooxigenase CYP4H10 [Tribolium castaneum]|uniref:Cytochrome P450-like protein n=1 Tax=Tribolium castaneum TaxID=7070 RepID=D6WFN7_TRICA|nr:cytochrome P450 monooxigenase CYP4H10 [Tribolium castaneum]EFA01322.2 cytochrome P450-like protein [Tribolium castaneum]|eukprot:NP_001107836.1 cytochrome P450 monooxigenase CYP4H10 [Tribolium castaneum]
MILAIVIALISAPFIWWMLILSKYRSLSNVPGPKPSPVIGNSLHIGYRPQDLFNNIVKWAKEYGTVYKIFVANDVRVLITNPELTELVLSSNVHITKSNAYDLLKPWLGIGLLISTGKKWKSRRKLITPTFHFKILDQFLDVFNSCGNVLVQRLSSQVGKDSFDVYPFINLCSLDIICETSMGVKIKAQQGNNTEYVEAVRRFLDIFIIRTFSVWKGIDALFKFSSAYSVYKRLLKILHQFTINIIVQRRGEKAQQKTQNVTSDDGIKRKVALLEMLLESEDNNMLSNEDIREEIDTFMFEGHDTTTSGIAFAILCLAENPKVQEKLYEEVVAVIDNIENITMQQLQEMKYLEMVLKEAQRLYPSVPVIERRLEVDCNIGGYDFPKDTFLSLFIYGMHHNEKYFPEPEKFDPNRYLPENQAKRHNYAYVPFSAGPRNCIGQKFAMLEMKTTIAKIVKHFKILPVPDYKPDLGIAAILKSYNGVCVRLQHRHGN